MTALTTTIQQAEAAASPLSLIGELVRILTIGAITVIASCIITVTLLVLIWRNCVLLRKAMMRESQSSSIEGGS